MDTPFKKKIKEKMEKSIGAVQKEFNTIRTGRANPLLLDRIVVEYYGTPTPLKQLANVAVPEGQLLTIKPFDPTILGTIEKAILASDLGITPTNDGSIIRLNIPPLTEERRKGLVKQIKKEAEEGKVSIRNIRRGSIEEIKKLEKDGEITEDESKKWQEELQRLTDESIQHLEEITKEKEKEILTV